MTARSMDGSGRRGLGSASVLARGAAAFDPTDDGVLGYSKEELACILQSTTNSYLHSFPVGGLFSADSLE